jgi:hypothetical protein
MDGAVYQWNLDNSHGQFRREFEYVIGGFIIIILFNFFIGIHIQELLLEISKWLLVARICN